MSYNGEVDHSEQSFLASTLSMEDPPSSPREPNPKKLKMSTATTTSDDEDCNTTTPGVTPEKKPRYKRRKIAIFFAYCGVGYQGMQKNPGAKTIEGDLEEALFLSGAVPEHDRGHSKRYDWARSARTDKGVSAVGQVVSGRFYIDPPGLVDRLHSNLSPQIRIFGYKRVTGSFNAKKFCDRRRYVYLIPVFALDPSSHPDRESVLASLGSGNELFKCLECSERGRKVVGVMGKRSLQFKTDTKVISGDISVSHPETTVEADVLSNGETAIPHSEIIEDTVVYSENGANNKSKFESVDNDAVHNESNALHSEPVMQENKIEGDIYVSHPETTVEADFLLGDETTISHSELKEDTIVSSENGDNNKSNSESAEEIDNDDVHNESNVLHTEPVIEEMKIEGELDECRNREIKPAKGSGFRYGEKEREMFNRILKRYEGTHNFHNFTTRTKAEDPSAQRFIVSFDANITVTVEGIEFVKCEVVGQSFMLHQIRKMIGLAVAIMRNCATESLIETALCQDVNINVPTAPEVGLYLDECFFTSYNQKWKDSHEELSMKAYAEAAEDFKVKHIYSHIASTEHNEGAVALWLHSLNHRNYPDLRVVSNGGTTDGKSGKLEDVAE